MSIYIWLLMMFSTTIFSYLITKMVFDLKCNERKAKKFIVYFIATIAFFAVVIIDLQLLKYYEI